MGSRRLPGPVVALAVALLLGLAAKLQAVRDSAWPLPAVEEDAVYVTSGSALRRMAGAYDALAADVYWIRALQAYGGTKLRLQAEPAVPEPPPALAVEHTEYGELYPLLDITTSLDPRFNIAYRFGAVFLAEPYPAGPGRADLAIRLLQKGLRARPDKWEYMQDIGFVHYWYRHDYEQASTWFRRASDVPGAPWWLKSLAATTLAAGGDRRSSRIMWQAIRDSAEVEWLRQDADRRLAQLRALDEIDALQATVDRLAAGGPPPSGWAAVQAAQGWPGAPADPAGVPYRLGPDGRVTISPASPLAPLPAEQEPPPAAPRPRS